MLKKDRKPTPPLGFGRLNPSYSALTHLSPIKVPKDALQRFKTLLVKSLRQEMIYQHNSNDVPQAQNHQSSKGQAPVGSMTEAFPHLSQKKIKFLVWFLIRAYLAAKADCNLTIL